MHHDDTAQGHQYMASVQMAGRIGAASASMHRDTAQGGGPFVSQSMASVVPAAASRPPSGSGPCPGPSDHTARGRQAGRPAREEGDVRWLCEHHQRVVIYYEEACGLRPSHLEVGPSAERPDVVRRPLDGATVHAHRERHVRVLIGWPPSTTMTRAGDNNPRQQQQHEVRSRTSRAAQDERWLLPPLGCSHPPSTHSRPTHRLPPTSSSTPSNITTMWGWVVHTMKARPPPTSYRVYRLPPTSSSTPSSRNISTMLG